MHVLFVHEGPRMGGVHNVAHHLASALAERGWTVEHLALSAGINRPSMEQVSRVRRRRGILLATNNYSAAYATAAIAALARRPWVMWVHGPVREVLDMGGTGRLKRGLLKRFYRSVPIVVTSSESTRHSFEAFCDPPRRQQRQVIRNVAASAFHVPASSGEAIQSADHVDIGYVGRLSAEKQPIQLLDLLDHLPPHYRLQVVGDGPLGPALQLAGARHVAAGRLTWLGSFATNAQTYRQWRATVLCSAYEGYPLTALESLASGVPVVSTPIPALTEMLAPHAPYLLAQAATPQALARAVVATLSLDADEVAQDIVRINQAHGPAAFVAQWHDLLARLQEGV